MDPWIILLEDTRGSQLPAQRLARSLAEPARIVTVGPAGRDRSAGRVHLDRPCKAGTGPDVLLALLHVLARDLDASVVIVPGDLRNEGVADVGLAVRSGLDAPDGDVVHVVACERAPGPADRWVSLVEREDDAWPVAQSVRRGAPPSGALAVDGVVAASAWRLASLVREAMPQWFRALRRAAWRPDVAGPAYAILEPFDLVDDVLFREPGAVRVVPVLHWERGRIPFAAGSAACGSAAVAQ